MRPLLSSASRGGKTDLSKVVEKHRELAVKILTILEKGDYSWGDLLRKTLSLPGRFSRVMRSLREDELVQKLGERGGRAPYRITEKGEKQLQIWKSKNES